MPLKRLFLLTTLLPAFTSKAQTMPVGTSVQVREFNSDSLYKNGIYKVTLSLFGERDGEYDHLPNTIFTVSKWKKESYLSFYTDSVYSRAQEVRFEDFNGDGVPDILVQNQSDVRSNQTYNLYLMDTARSGLKKVKGFGEIKNPTYIPEGNFIESNVVSGTNWTGFYDIVGDTVRDFELVIYDNQQEDGSYERDYRKALKVMAAKRKQHK